jgi:ABC-type uncharacterized transport system auxiliary subunit
MTRLSTNYSWALLCLLFTALITSCAGAPLPDYHYYRLKVVAPAATKTAVRVKGMVLVEAPRAPAVYVPRAIAYSNDAPHLSLEHYHYHAWIDTPARLLQQELISYLQAAGFAAVVVPEAGRVQPDYRIAGSLRRFERLKTNRGWEAVVALELRAEGNSPAMPLLVRSYEKSLPAADATMEATVQAFSAATTGIFQQFAADLSGALTAGKSPHPHPLPKGEGER